MEIFKFIFIVVFMVVYIVIYLFLPIWALVMHARYVKKYGWVSLKLLMLILNTTAFSVFLLMWSTPAFSMFLLMWNHDILQSLTFFIVTILQSRTFLIVTILLVLVNVLMLALPMIAPKFLQRTKIRW